MEEVWKDAIYIDQKGNVIDFQGWYQVSNRGRIRSFRGRGGSQIKNVRNTAPTLMKTKTERNGYHSITLRINDTKKLYLLHRLILSTFVPIPKELENEKWIDVNHIDEDKHNNTLENLEWCTRKVNNSHGTRTKRAIEKGSKTKETKEWKDNHSGSFVHNSRSVIGVHVKDGTTIEFESMSKVNIYFNNNMADRSVSATIRGKQKTAYGYYWYYKEDYERIEQGVTTNGDECNRVQ